MRNLFFRSASPSPSNSPSRSTIPPSSPRRSFSDSLMEENIEVAQTLITKWDSSDDSSYTKLISLFRDDRREAKLYLKCVKDLQSAMHHFVDSQETSAEKLITAQTLMQAAMKRLEKEFYQILSDNRENLEAETVSSSRSSESRASTPRTSTRSSVSDLESESEDESSILEGEHVSHIPMDDLKSIADCMISAGYGKECVKIYKIIRKSNMDEALYHLGVEKMTLSQVQKMDWNVLETKIKNWLNAVKVAVKTLFYGERLLCDHVFSASDSIRESCFTEISKEAATTLFSFPELVAKCKKSPEKMFRTLDLYQAISDLWPEIESIFSFESTSAVRSSGVNSLIKLGEAVRTMLEDFEAAIQKDHSKTAVPAGGVHPLTRYVMNYITFLTDYTEILADIFADYPLTLQTPLPEAYFGCYDVDESPISVRIAWLVLVLLCKLDGKAELYKDVALSYLFLANNLQYVVAKIRNSTNLKYLLGDYWVRKHESKVKQYAGNYERMGWSKVYASLPENPTADISSDQAKKYFKQFNAAFEEVYKKQSTWVVTDSKLRDELKVTVAKKLVPVYREFYEMHRVGLRKECGVDSLVRYAPENLDNYLSDLLYGDSGAGSVSSSFSTSSSSSRGRC
ncbi:PREDICTED: exocyst complex component EXO70A1-like [Fragaria vesca subsp. vesca]|uniref:exocyst complex component EXO70A1-like n=1 Tax=Fragaria vesca subsp. vesca TaxID=101020 RepID=UPI0002C2EAFD|nr:PREDICTED: exocyst complex component EXO70A1-like [Fragaria vesca subsp. vesca]